ncbi:MAG: DUF3332 domain-containing protein [Proteobacteria bacterium]|nr:DUF3332 domain-containing protein [Pseudomonadota bacterium]
MKRFIAFLLLICLTNVYGCFGKFNLTRKVYDINSKVSDKFLRSAVTWAFIIIPVYGISALLDFVLFNTIEFWTGKNPIAEKEKEFFYAYKDDLFYIKAKKTKNDEVVYKIRHYRGDVLCDTLEINWNLADGTSKGLFKNNKETVLYMADQDGLKKEEHLIN